MALEPDARNPGLWTDPAANPGDPGTFGVVVGVSRYRHLAGGQGPSAKKQFPGLKQLNVSALTAYRFFDWLRAKYHYRKSPLVHCWLLLAPSDREKALIDKDTLAHAVEPTFDACDRALNDWFTVMSDLSADRPETARGCRSFFFFSGHGVEFHLKKQCLLPADFPIPDDQPRPQERVDKVIGTGNLVEAMSGLRVPSHFFFLDACRNDVDGLKASMPIEGYPILPIPTVRGATSSSIFRFHATTTGTQAFQGEPPDLSLFGQALMEGLSAPPELNPDCDDQSCAIPADKLMCFLELRIGELLLKYPGYHQQPLCSFDARNPATVLAQVPPFPAAAAMADPCRRLDAESVAYAVESLGPAPQRGFAQGREVLRPVTGVPTAVTALASRRWDFANDSVRDGLKETVGRVTSSALSPDGARLAVAVDGHLRLVDAMDGDNSRHLEWPGAPLSFLTFSHDGARLAAAGPDGRVPLWDTATGRMVMHLGEPGKRASSLAFSPEGPKLAIARADGQVQLWDINGDRSFNNLDERGSMVTSLAYSPSGPRLAVARAGGQVRIWETTTNRVVAELEQPGKVVMSLAFSPDGELVAGASDGVLRLWDASSGRSTRHLGEPGNRVTALAFGQNPKWVAAAGADGRIRVWDGVGGDLVRTLPGYSRGLTRLAFSRGGPFLTSAGLDQITEAIWTPESTEQAQGLLKKRREAMLVGLELAGRRDDGDTATLLRETLEDVGRAEAELDRNKAQWLNRPVRPVVYREAAEQLLSQMEISAGTGDPSHPFRSIEPRELVVHRFDRVPGERTYRIELGFRGKMARYWIGLRGSPLSYVCSLLSGTTESTRYLLEISSEGRHESGALRLVRVRADLSERNEGNLGAAAALWNRVGRAGTPEAALQDARELLNRSLGDGDSSPLAAIVSLLVLLRGGPVNELPESVGRLNKDLARWPDIAAIQVELLYRLRESWEAPPPAVVELLLAMKDRGLPHCGDALGYLSDRVDATLRFHQLEESTRSKLDQLRQAVCRTLIMYRTGGLFCVFGGSLQGVDPLLLSLPG
jgi:hypothetical protein